MTSPGSPGHSGDIRASARISRAAPRLLGAVLVLVAGLGAGCRQSKQPEVVLYVSADAYVARMVIDRFEAETGIAVKVVGDTEAKKTTGLVERLRAERDRPQADVLWSSEIFMTIGLAEDGVLASYSSPAAADWPEAWRDSERRWYAMAARARVIVYAPDRLPAEDRPVTWTDLTHSRYRGRIVMADPRFGTTGGHLGAMKAYWDRAAMPGYYTAFLMGLRDNEVRLLPSGNAGVVRAIADGEADLGLTDTDDVWAAQTQGLDVAIIYPAHSHEREEGNGTLLIPNTVALVAGARHPAPAGRLIDFLMSEAVERMLAESVSHNIPLRPGLAAAYPEYAVENPLDVNYRRAASVRRAAVAEAMRLFAASDQATDAP